MAVASRLFADNGWSGTGMRDVARAAQVSVETVYANFGSKGSLLRQAHHDRLAALRADLGRLAALAETESVRSRQLTG